MKLGWVFDIERELVVYIDITFFKRRFFFGHMLGVFAQEKDFLFFAGMGGGKVEDIFGKYGCSQQIDFWIIECTVVSNIG